MSEKNKETKETNEPDVSADELAEQALVDDILADVTAEDEKEVVEQTAEEKLQAELAEMEDKFLRAQAEIANMRNRFKKEREDLARFRAQDLAKELLPALDNLERALAIEVEDEQGQSLKKGIEMVKESILHAFKSAGIEEIPALGEIFDPNLHQAVQTMPLSDGQKADEIIQVLQNGYILHGRVLRASMVIVAQ